MLLEKWLLTDASFPEFREFCFLAATKRSQNSCAVSRSDMSLAEVVSKTFATPIDLKKPVILWAASTRGKLPTRANDALDCGDTETTTALIFLFSDGLFCVVAFICAICATPSPAASRSAALNASALCA